MVNEDFKLTVPAERVLMKTLHAVIRDDEDDFEAQLESFSTGKDLVAANVRCIDLTALIVSQKYGGRPSDEEIERIGARAARFASWSGITPAEYETYFYAMLNSSPISPALELGAALRAPFILLATLLINFRLETQTWVEYLDAAWDALFDGPPVSFPAVPPSDPSADR